MKQFLKTQKLKLTAISPIHIGNDKIFDPTEYTIVGNNIYIFDTFQFVKTLPQDEHQKLIQVSKNELQLQSFFQKHKKIAIEASHTVVKVVPSIAKEFEEKLKKILKNKDNRDINILNKLEIQAHIRTARQLYLPGNSIKSALKTAFFQHYINLTIAKDRTKNIKNILLGNWIEKFEKDIFSKLRIDDAISNELLSEVYWVINKQHTKDNNDSLLSGCFECIVPNSKLQTNISIIKYAENSNIDYKKFHSSYFDTNNFRIIVKNFYLPLLKKELDWAKINKNLVPISVYKRMVKAYNQTISKKGFIFKVGHYSNAKKITLEDSHKIKILQERIPKFVQEPYFYWLTSKEKNIKNASFIGWIYAEFIN